MMAAPGARRGFGAVVVFAIAMGWLESVVVVYLRSLVGLAYGEGMPPWNEVMARIHARPGLLAVEQGREIATMAMIAAVAWMAAGDARGRIGAYLAVFGIWDLVYYVGLYLMVGWPRSLAAMDLLFLLPPHPWWYQPVGLPVTIAAGMTVAGALLFRARR